MTSLYGLFIAHVNTSGPAGKVGFNSFYASPILEDYVVRAVDDEAAFGMSRVARARSAVGVCTMKVAFLGDPRQICQVFARGRREAVEARADVIPGVFATEDLNARLSELSQVEALFSTWGMSLLTEAQLDAMPKMRALFYAAGAVAHFAQPLIDRGIYVSSAWQANAIPVAEFALSQILLCCKGYFRNVSEYSRSPGHGNRCFRGPGAFGETVALLGAGAIGTKLIELLRPFRLDVMVFDPFLTQERATSLGVCKVSLETAFSEGFVVSNHLIDNRETADMIDGKLLASMRTGATFINTGRGRTVRHKDLIEVLRRRTDLSALLDVTDPEPLPSDSPLFTMPNVIVSTHIAGSIGDEILRLADYAIEEFDRYRQGQSLRYRVLVNEWAPQ